MKPIIASSAALAATLLLSSTAIAAEPLKLSVSGYMAAGFGYVERAGTNQSDIGVLRDGEIHFEVKGSSDNGLTFEARVELEVFTTRDQIDENWVSVSGDFGTLMIGGIDSAKTRLQVGVLYPNPDKIGYYDDDADQGLTGGVDGGTDSIGIHYTTPNYGGFQAAFSYQPSASDDGGGDTNILSLGAQDVLAVAGGYRGSFSDVDVAFSASFESTDSATGRSETWGLGAEAGYGGFVLAGYFEENYDDTEDYVIGLGYQSGPWTIAGGYSLTDSAGADDVDTFSGWVSYQLAPGLRLTSGLTYATGGAVPAGTHNDGVIGMSWMTLDF